MPYWRLSGFYFFYFGFLGIFMPYWSLYLKSLDFDAKQIGILSGAVLATKIFAPSIWGWLADTRGKRMGVIRLGSFLALLSFAGIYISHNYLWLIFVVITFSFFWNAVLSQFEVLTLAHLGRQYNRYSQIRVWGSIGFIVAVVVLGLLFDFVSIQMLPLVMCFFLGGIWIFSLLVPEKSVPARHVEAGLMKIVCQPSVLSFMAACCLLQIAHGPYNTFFSVYLEKFEFSRTFIGQLWALGVLSEVALFVLMHRVMPFFGVRKLILLSLGISVVRWIIIAYGVHSITLLLLAQLMHAATFGAFHAAAIELIRRTFPQQFAGQGQAVYSGLSFGVGGALGAVLSGFMWDYSASATFVMASVASALAFIIAWCWVEEGDEKSYGH